MACSFRKVMHLVTGLLLAAWGVLDARADEAPPSAPTLADAHGFFESLVADNQVTALYTASRDGEFLGYLAFPVRQYAGTGCKSEMRLANDVHISVDWSLAGKSQVSDGEMGMWRRSNVVYEFFHMLAMEGGMVAAPANNIPRLILAVTDEVSRNRLFKAVNLLASTCRAKSKFD